MGGVRPECQNRSFATLQHTPLDSHLAEANELVNSCFETIMVVTSWTIWTSRNQLLSPLDSHLAEVSEVIKRSQPMLWNNHGSDIIDHMDLQEPDAL